MSGSPDNEAVVLGMWAEYDREGMTGVPRWAADDAVWRPHSSKRARVPLDRRLPHLRRGGDRARDPRRLDPARRSGRTTTSSRSAGGCGCARAACSRTRGCTGSHLPRVRDGKVHWTASSPDLGAAAGRRRAARAAPTRRTWRCTARRTWTDARWSTTSARPARGSRGAPSTCGSSRRRSSPTRARCRRSRRRRPTSRARSLEERAAFSLTLNAINFGSGWFPTLRKPAGPVGLPHGRGRPARPRAVDGGELARDRDAGGRGDVRAGPGARADGAVHARAARARRARSRVEYFGRFLGLVRSAEGSAERLAETLATWPTWHDVSSYEGERVPFYKRAQIAAADLAPGGHRAGRRTSIG